MNVIVSNKQKEIIDNANIDAIKDLNGLFNVNDLINKFKNYFFSKMILDATSVINFASRDVLTTLANEIGAEKLIILLPSSPEPPLEFKKLLIDLKIYNYTNDINDVIRFIEKPNTYEDAIKQIDDSYNNDVYVDNSIKEGEEPSNEEEVNDNNSEETNYKSQSSLGDILNNLNVGDSSGEDNHEESYETEEEKSESNEEESVASYSDTVNELNDINVESNEEPVMNNHNTFLITDDFTNAQVRDKKITKLVIGVKNITVNAGSTSLIYMLHRMASLNLKKNVLSVEIGKNDFRLFRDNKMVSTSKEEAKDIISNSDAEVIFVDLNDTEDLDLCDDILYLVEPSVIKLNGLMAINRNIFKELKGKKVLLNKSLLSKDDIKILEREAGMEFFETIAPLNDRILNDPISKLLGLLGIK